MGVVCYLSPHADDVALGCGGSVAADAAAGEEVLLVTVFNVGVGQAERQAEDRAAAAVLGCALRTLELPDAPERPEVRGRLGLFAPLGQRHLGILAEVVARLRKVVPPGARLVAPLGVGGHIDHRLVHSAARALAEDEGFPLSLYEDQPYSLARYALGRRLAALGARLPAGVAPERAAWAEEIAAQRRYLAALPVTARMAPGLRQLALHVAARAVVAADAPGRQPGARPHLWPRRRLVEPFAARRFRAAAAYASQWPLLFPSLEALEGALRAYGADEAGLTERFWDVV